MRSFNVATIKAVNLLTERSFSSLRRRHSKPVVAEGQTDYTVYFKNGTVYAWAGRAATQANIRIQEGVGVGGYLRKFLLGVCR